MRIVSTVHKAGFDLYGHRWIENIENWPAAEFRLYCEGFMPDHPCEVDIGKVDRLTTFKRRHANYVAPSWRFDIVRFSNKVFAAHDALRDYDGIGVWLDADCVTFNRIPAGYIEEQLGDAYFAHFRRAGHYTETGMWIVNCAHPVHAEFMDTWLRWFEDDAFKGLHEWHDCTALDATLRQFLKAGKITTKSLSGEFEGDLHPMAHADIAKYIDHCKGHRKAAGVSPENAHRA